MKIKMKIFLALILSLVLCTCAYAQIDNAVVEAAWKRIATTDGFEVVKINYEKDDSPNAWVQFKSQKDFSVHVTQGLMKILDTEEQIAGVLGHEIGHVRLGHYNKGVGRNIGWAILGAALGKNRSGGRKRRNEFGRERFQSRSGSRS